MLALVAALVAASMTCCWLSMLLLMVGHLPSAHLLMVGALPMQMVTCIGLLVGVLILLGINAPRYVLKVSQCMPELAPF